MIETQTNRQHGTANLRINLPKISKQNQEKQNFRRSVSPNIKLDDFKKLYFQYKSNARILEFSPYRTINQRKKVAHLLHNSHRYQQFEHNDKLTKRCALTLQQSTKHQINVSVQLTKNKFHKCKIAAQISEQFCQKLKRQISKIQHLSKPLIHRKCKIIGFETIQLNFQIDAILSQPSINILSIQNLSLRPIYIQKRSDRITLEDFKFIKCLGSGGFSVVFLVRGNFNCQYYAMKLIDKQFIIESQRQGIVQNERYILGQLKNKFVTQMSYCFETKNHFVFVIQYCPGGQLFYQLKKVKKMSEDQAKFYFLEILIGLNYIHDKNIIYRDLKPENLLLGADGHVKIADFGLSKPIQNKKQISYSFCGSPQYMAPQMLVKIGHNHLLDYYCLGALLYELVIGIPPYYSTNHEQIYDSILNQKLTFPPHVQLSNQIMSLLQGLLQKQVNKRLGSLFGIKQILFHPWIGKMKQQTIENKQLVPPFIPNLKQFNFDLNQIKDSSPEFIKKIEEDIKQKNSFQTYFNDDFYYEKQPRKSIKNRKIYQQRKYNSLEKQKPKKQLKILKKKLSLTHFQKSTPIR